MARRIQDESIESMSDKKLMSLAQNVCDSIYYVMCYSPYDLILLDDVLTELKTRGYKRQDRRVYVFTKEED